MLQRNSFPCLLSCLGRCKVSGPACTRWICWWGCAAVLACVWRCISKVKTPRSTVTAWSMVLPVGVHNLKCKELYMDAQEDMHMNDYSKITALYSRLSVGDEDRDGGESNSIQNQKIFLENYARGQHLTNIRHYIDDDESGRFFRPFRLLPHDRGRRKRGKIGVCIMKDMTRWGARLSPSRQRYGDFPQEQRALYRSQQRH